MAQKFLKFRELKKNVTAKTTGGKAPTVACDFPCGSLTVVAAMVVSVFAVSSSWAALRSLLEMAEASTALNTNFRVGECGGIHLNGALHRPNSGLSTTRYEVVIRSFEEVQIKGCNLQEIQNLEKKKKK